MKDRNTKNQNQVALMSLPSYGRMVSQTEGLNDTKWERVMIMLKRPSNKTEINQLIMSLK